MRRRAVAKASAWDGVRPVGERSRRAWAGPRSSCAAARVAPGTGRSSGSGNVDAGARPGAPATRESDPVRRRARRNHWARHRSVKDPTREAVTPRARRLAYCRPSPFAATAACSSEGASPGPGTLPKARRQCTWSGFFRLAGRMSAWGAAHDSFVATSAAAPKARGGASDEHAAVAAVGPSCSTEPACTRRDSGTRQTRSSSAAPSLVSPRRPQSGGAARVPLARPGVRRRLRFGALASVRRRSRLWRRRRRTAPSPARPGGAPWSMKTRPPAASGGAGV